MCFAVPMHAHTSGRQAITAPAIRRRSPQTRYLVSVVGELPPNLIEKIAAIHGAAILTPSYVSEVSDELVAPDVEASEGVRRTGSRRRSGRVSN